jgi:8-oxo-dGTP diphosphatase
MSNHPRVGVGVFVFRAGLILLGERRGAHGAGTWALPGGHLEFGESVEHCALREVHEETGLAITDVRPGPFTSDVFAVESKHYVTLFVLARSQSGAPRLLEPEKCAGWIWRAWSEFPTPLFAPLQTLRDQGYVPAHPAGS